MADRGAEAGVEPGFQRGDARFDGPAHRFVDPSMLAGAIHKRGHTLIAEMERIACDPTQPVSARIMAARTALPFLLPRRTAKSDDEAAFSEDVVETTRQRRNQLADLRALAIASEQISSACAPKAGWSKVLGCCHREMQRRQIWQGGKRERILVLWGLWLRGCASDALSRRLRDADQCKQAEFPGPLWPTDLPIFRRRPFAAGVLAEWSHRVIRRLWMSGSGLKAGSWGFLPWRGTGFRGIGRA